jgi:hypothetical protein
MSETQHRQVIVLREKNGDRSMPIIIGLSEVFALHRVINNESPPRPLTHELFGQVLDVLGVTVERVVICNLTEGTYYGRLILKRDGRTYDVDSRPSDAIVLAAQKGAPIFVEEAVLQEGARDYE